MPSRRSLTSRLLILLLLPVVAGIVWLASDTQRSMAESSFDEAANIDRARVAMFDLRAALRTYLLTGDPEAIDVFEDAGRTLERAFAAAELDARDESDEERILGLTVAAARRWQEAAEHTMSKEQTGNRADLSVLTQHDRLFTGFRMRLDALEAVAADERHARQRYATTVALIAALLLGAAAAAISLVILGRRSREARRRHAQTVFARTLQAARVESEAHHLLKRHIELSLPDANATVLRRNNSANRLEATTPLPEGSSLAPGLEAAAPDACVAIRLGRPYGTDAAEARLLGCDVCGAEGRSTCVPTLVGGEVIGAVNVAHPRPLDVHRLEVVTDSVAQAAPVVANLRTLAVAEQRAATDGLTGLPNARAGHETLARLVAHAARTGNELGVVLFDLDHFKAINDTFGHAKGDELLAAVGDVTTSTLRASDFAARIGGEEFLLLLPDTDRAGVIEVAEKVRRTLHAVRIQGVQRDVAASFGVAVYPADGLEPASLLRSADRALYSAKATGRDRVCVLESDQPAA